MELEPIQQLNKKKVDATEKPEEKIPEVELTQPEVKVEPEPIKTIPIEKISQLIMSFTTTATTAPTHSPRSFYEQLVWKDDGTDRILWIWGQKDGVWRHVHFT